jgi:biopolymer transport protein ExbD
MGAKLGQAIGRARGGDDLVEAHEINVTPFIDVMLVLLIIFMVAAPLATVDLGVDLPASAVEPQPRPDQPGRKTSASICAPTRPSAMAT